MTDVNPEEVKQAARDQAWDEGKPCENCNGNGTVPGGRRLIHTYRGAFGADWELDEVIEFIGKAESMTWTKGIFGEIVIATAGDDRVIFELRKPITAAVEE